MLDAETKMSLQIEWDLDKLLTEWKLENILPHLIAEKVDVDILKMMKVSHIRLLLHSFPIGTQIRFEYNLEQWRNDIGKPLKFYIYDDINPIILQERAKNDKALTKATSDINSTKLCSSKMIETDINSTKNSENPTKDSNGYNHLINKSKTEQKYLLNTQPDETATVEASFKSTSFIQTIKTPSAINLHKILLNSQPDGSVILDAYHRNNKFSHPERRLLINTIVNYYLENNKEFNLQTSYDLENAILEMFPNERLAMYRIAKQGKIFLRYIAAKEGGTKQKRFSERVELGDTNHGFNYDSSSENDDHYLRNSMKPTVTNMAERENEQNDESLVDPDDYAEESRVVNSTSEIEEILLQTSYNGCKKFVKIFKPFKYHDFVLAACRVFNKTNVDEHCAAVNDCEISENDFKNVVLQYYKLSTFTMELKEKSNDMSEILVPKVEQIESSCSPAASFPQTTPFINASMDNSSVQIIYNHLPDANDIRNLPSLLPIVKMADNGKTLENKHRNHIAKAIIDECLNFQPERILKRQDFFTLTENLVCAFPNEVASAYFIPSQPNHAARGKLWNAYNNKRNFFGRSGIVQRRPINNKRKCLSDQEEDSEKTSEKVFIADKVLEIEDFSQNSTLDWNTLKQKWSDCHRERRHELVKLKVSPHDYMTKFSILQGVLGIDLMEIDVNILYPTVANVNNWLSLYEKVIEKARLRRKYDLIARILDAIDSSNDEKYRASLTLMLISYIFPYNARRNDTNGEKASKSEIQERFVKEYASMEDLKSDNNCAELQIRFVHQSQQIEYAEFTIGGFTFKCIDLLEALSSIFHYIMAMHIEYPQMCLHIWQFVQLAIFQVEIQGYKLPNVDSTINDLYMN